YSLLRIQLHREIPSLGASVEEAEKSSPQHQFQLHSYFTLPRNFELDASLYHASAVATQQLPNYTRLDARFGWRVREGIELSIGLQNLLNNRRQEFNGTDISVLPSLVKRSLYGKLTWRF